MSATPPPLLFTWSTALADEPGIVDMFLRQANAHYISHSELQGNRADAPGRWRGDLAQSLQDQVRAVHAQAAGPTASVLIAKASSDGDLAGVAFVSIDQERAASTPFACLDDLIVDPRYRGAGVGQGLVDWVSDALRERGVRRLFLESGIGNEVAHAFFVKRGFVPVSLVMLKELVAADENEAVPAGCGYGD